MRLQADVLRYMSKGELRVLTAVEMGMKNHEYVSCLLLEEIAGLRRHSIQRILRLLLKNKLIFHSSQMYDGYKLTYLGYDYLALNAFVKRKLIKGVGARVGVGKESDIHLCEGTDGTILILKLHRLGRISFRSIKKNRDYMQHRTHCSWQYLSHLAAVREFAFLKNLFNHQFPVPQPVDVNRHAILMHYVDAIPLTQVRELKDPLIILEKLMKLIVRLAHCGLIHGDFNEFNLMIHQDTSITMIDLPQMVSIYHPNAKIYFQRDVECIKRLFERKFLVEVTSVPKFEDVVNLSHREGNDACDEREEEISVSDGLNEEETKLLETALAARKEGDACSDRGVEESSSEGEGEDNNESSDESESNDMVSNIYSDGGLESEEKGKKDRDKEKHKRAGGDSTEGSDGGSSEEDATGDADEEPSQPLPREEQLALIHCWRPTAKRHTRDAVRHRVKTKQKKKNSRGNYGNNKNVERIKAKQMIKFDC